MSNKKRCSNCLIGRKMVINSDILCVINGVVSEDYLCSRHRFAPLMETKNTISYKCCDCRYFIQLSIDENGGLMGYCHMFTVRHYNGSLRKICSKFEKEISDNKTNFSLQNFKASSLTNE